MILWFLLGFFLVFSVLSLGLWFKKSQQLKKNLTDQQELQEKYQSLSHLYQEARIQKELFEKENTSLKQQEQNLQNQYVEATKQHSKAQESFELTQKKMHSLESELTQLRNELSENKELKIQFESQFKSTKEQLENEKQLLAQATEKLQDSFKSLAAQALEGNNKQFIELAKNILEKESTSAKTDLDKKHTSIVNVINPLKESLDKYLTHINDLEKERQKSYTLVESELKRIMESHQTLTQETSALKNALKKPHVRGRWGEVQLKNCIEIAGMSEHSDVQFQDVTQTEGGKLLIPDLTVRMPGGRLVIVDAKTPIDAFLDSLEATSEETRREQMERHGRHVKNHIKNLASKNYAENFQDSADFIVMFLPNESFLYAALEVEPDLMEYALNKKILIATPPTFIGLLKVIRFGWNEEKLAENAKNISLAGQELHKRVCDFMESFTSVGKHMDKAKEEYERSFRRLESRVLVQAKRLEKLGAKSAKSLPKELHVEVEALKEAEDGLIENEI